MKPIDIWRELAYPATNGTVLIAMVSFFLLIKLALFAGLIGLFLALVVSVAITRYLMFLLEARARGRDPNPPGIELFAFVGGAWNLFPVVHIGVLVYATYALGSLFGGAVLLVVDLLLAILIPASLAVLAITRSPTESLKPRGVLGVIDRCGVSYWVVPAYLFSTTLLVWWLSQLPVADFVLEFISLYLLFAFFALMGGLIQPLQLDREIDIPLPAEPDAKQLSEDLEKQRIKVLNHAYGFVSRGNRAGGLQHIHAWLAEDPQPATGWPWFVNQMLRWEVNEAALPFAQQYLGRLLHNGEQVAAMKLLMRCRLVNEAFRPLPEDCELALEAAEACQHDELISFLR